ncbi:MULTISPECIES: ABC transporter permease [Clavibacter]|uniref:ABC3 transporter permease C-terminal domain-containing protein n=1 Tax=Clavibacter tessellarius TaxID=31965 RepID=A0A154V590_9MICO|nr:MULTISPECIES: ABC transporter permease [Clavibacter]KZC96543.1 hypothetical protein AWH51_02260 [Clavibacter michiganensis subsp. tessellarius]MDA3804071.1 ABC transporter permease [Clavibacter sp. CT19]
MKVSALRGHGPSVLVATLSSAFGTTLLLVVGDLSTMISANGYTGGKDIVIAMLTAVGVVFIAIATFVGAVVTANAFATIIAGRTRTIALLRLIGASASSQRRAVAREGLAVGAVGSVLGVGVGIAATAALLAVATSLRLVPDLPYALVQPAVALPVVAVLLTTWLASWIGSRRVLDVSPMQAVGGAQEMRHEEARRHRGRDAVAVVLLVLGIGLLALGIVKGLEDPIGILPSAAGGLLSFSGFVLGAPVVMPTALRLVGRVLGRGPSGRLAAENAVRYPERSTRTTTGLVIGVALVTMFAVASASVEHAIARHYAHDPESMQAVAPTLVAMVVVFSVLTGFSALIAAIGMMSTLALSVLQRTRELGLLRALGFTTRQLRRMITVESAQLTVTAVLVGLALGTVYGWAGAQSLLASLPSTGGFIEPVVPLWLIAAVTVAATLLTVVASLGAARRVTRISPVAALAVE